MTKKKDKEHYKNMSVSENPDVVQNVVSADNVEVNVEDMTIEKACEKIKQLEKELAEKEDKHLRFQAEYDNYRKRVFKELTAARFSSTLDVIQPFLQVYDHFSMAVAASENADNMNAVKDGLKMILGEFSKAFDDLRVEKLNVVGQKFDPNLHEAVAHEASDEVPEGMVIKQWNCGYKMGNKLLRPSTVVVSSGPEKPEEQVESEQ